MEEVGKDVAFFIRKSNTMVPLPVKTETGKPDWVNLEWFFPGQMWLSLARNVSDRNLWEATRDIGMGNPFLDIYAMMKSGRGENVPVNPYNGMPLYNSLDSGTMKAVKTVEWFYNMWAPSMLTRYGTLGKILTTGEEDRYGRTGTVGKAVLSVFGLNIISPTEKQVIAEKKYEIKKIANRCV